MILSSLKITGAGNGIGRELACQLAEQGCLVLCVDINSEENEKTLKLIQDANTKNVEKITPISYQCDISDKIAVRILAKEVLSKYEKVDILINNAGVSYPNPLLKITDIEIEKLFQINLLSHFWVSLKSQHQEMDVIRIFLDHTSVFAINEEKSIGNDCGYIIRICYVSNRKFGRLFGKQKWSDRYGLTYLKL